MQVAQLKPIKQEKDPKLYEYAQTEEAKKKAQKGLSIYDIVKVKIIDEDTGSNYILSRFLVSRMLSACNMDVQYAGKIAKECKKRIVNSGKLEISSSELKTFLYEAMEQRGYGQFIGKFEQIKEFFQSRKPLMILISGTHLSLKTSVSSMCGDRLNIANIINSDLLKPLVNKFKKCELPLDSLDYTLKDDYLEVYKKQAKEIWRGAGMDILKVVQDGKPLMFEGEIGLQHYIKSPYGPSEERFEACQQFIEGKLDIIALDDQEIFQYFNKPNTGLKSNQYGNIDWIEEGAIQSELLMLKDIKDNIFSIDYTDTVILPIILIINKEDHLFLIKEHLLERFYYKDNGLDADLKDIDEMSLKYLERFQNIQNHIIQSSPGIIIPIRLVDNELTYNLIHTAFMMELNNINPKKM